MGLTTFSTGLSGLATNSQGLNVIGNNLANLNTVGYKTSNISFTDVLGQTFNTVGTAKSGNTMTIGLGAQVSGVRQVFNQGSVSTTNNPLDVAIQGKGFLVVKAADGGQFYSRAGNMHLDADGNLVAESGAQIQGYVRNATTGKIDTNLGVNSIKMPSGLDSPVATGEFELEMNLDANAVTGTQFSKDIQIYDSLGKPHLATLTLQKEISGGATPVTKWRFDVTIPQNEVAGQAASTAKLSLITGTVQSGAPTAGTLLFDSNGKMTSAWRGADPTPPPALGNLTIPNTGVTLPTMANGANLSSSINFKLLNSLTGLSNVTGYGSPSEVTAASQNGAAAGSLNNLAIQSDGTISAVFSNGNTVDVAQLVLAQFSNQDGLLSQGGGFYSETTASGASFFGIPGEGGRGHLISGGLEQSNVDLATELTKIITFQRGYQANAKIITLTDQIMQDTMNIRQ
ncbi:MAG TPA: flagellar hook protein FlgE [Terriglobia bacterium]|nr:flagellar hook protein FlgE [Terriglobia bacterium]